MGGHHIEHNVSKSFPVPGQLIEETKIRLTSVLEEKWPDQFVAEGSISSYLDMLPAAGHGRLAAHRVVILRRL